MTQRKMADSLEVIGLGVKLKSITVKEYKEFDKTIFRELIAYEIAEEFPGAFKNAIIQYASEPTRSIT